MKGDEEKKTVDDFPFLQRLLHGWMTPLVLRSNWEHFCGQGKVAEMKIPEVPRYLNSEKMERKMSGLFRKKNRYSIYSTIFMVFKFHILAVFLLELLNVVLSSLQPFILQLILQSIFPSNDRTSWKSDPRIGILSVFLYWMLDVLTCLIVRFSQQIYIDTIVGIKNGLVMMVYRKTFELSVTEISQLEGKNHSFSSFVMLESYAFSTFFASVVGLIMFFLRACINSLYLFNLSWPGLLIYAILTVFISFGLVTVIALGWSFSCLSKGNNAFSGYLSRIFGYIKFIKYNNLEKEYMEKIKHKQKKHMYLPLFLYSVFYLCIFSQSLVFSSISKIVLFSLSSVSVLDLHVVFSSLFIIDRIAQDILSLSLHAMLFSRAVVGGSRITDFLSLPENQKKDFLVSTKKTKNESKKYRKGMIRIRNMNFTISSEKTLHVDSIDVRQGETVCINGRSGSGKTSFLLSLLGELRSDLNSKKPDQMYSVTNSVSYCPQTPFIFHGTIEENILVGKYLDEERLEQVLRVCCLEGEFGTDPESLRSIVVSQSGTTISGGQKVRLGLARCLYRDCEIYLIDEITPHLDIQVRNEVFWNVFQFLSGKTLLLVTNDLSVQSLEDSFDSFVSVQNLKVRYCEKQLDCSSDEVDSSSDCSSEMISSTSITSSEEISVSSETLFESSSPETTEEDSDVSSDTDRRNDYVEKSDRVSTWNLLKYYASHFVSSDSLSKKLSFLLLVLVVIAAMKSLEHFLNLWMVFWPEDKIGLSNKTYFLIYLSAGLLFPIARFTFVFLLSFAATKTGINIQRSVIQRTLQSKLNMFYGTKLGEILNTIGGDFFHGNSWIVIVLSQLVVLSLDIIVVVGGLIVANPFAAIPCIFFIVFFILFNDLYLRFFRRAIHLCRHNEGLLISVFEESRDGIVSIRNMEQTSQNFFIEKARVCANKVAQSIYVSRNIEVWKDVRLGISNSSFIFASSMLILLMARYTSFGVKILSGFSLPGIYSLHYPLHQVCIELQWVSYTTVCLERTRNFSQKMDCESIEAVYSPQKDMSQKKLGYSVEFRNVSLRYFEKSPLVLRSACFSIDRGERVLVKGRTGSGKSSILECLLRGNTDYKGEILVNGKKDLALSELRNSISIVTQGEHDHWDGSSYRFYLDPKDGWVDREIYQVLKKVGFSELFNKEGFELGNRIDSSISKGERVLLSLARVVMRLEEKKIVCFDEITGGLDEKMLETLARIINGKEFSGKTLIMISHKEDLENIIHFDKLLFVNNGRVEVRTIR